MLTEIIEIIGLPAFLEQLAEEGSELSQASLKFARKLRNENPTPKTGTEVYKDLAEECADVLLCINRLMLLDDEFANLIMSVMEYKKIRWLGRLKQEESNR